MAEYIDKEAVALKVRRYAMPNVYVDGTVMTEDAERYFLKLLEEAPAADVEEVKHGRWIEQTISGEATWCCSECKTLGSPHWKRCPVCEAKMIGGQNEQKK